MFGWLRRMWDSAYGAVDNTVRTWVHDLVNGLYGFLHMIFGDVGKAWDALESSAWQLYRSIELFLRNTALAFWHIIRVLIPAAIAEARKLFGEVEAYAKGVYWYAVREIRYVVNLISSSISALWQLVIRDVWRPLSSAIAGAWHWITHEGATVYFYITHPDKLIDLVWTALLSKLEHEAWTAGALLGKFFLSLIIRNLKRFALLVEDIIDAVL